MQSKAVLCSQRAARRHDHRFSWPGWGRVILNEPCEHCLPCCPWPQQPYLWASSLRTFKESKPRDFNVFKNVKNRNQENRKPKLYGTVGECVHFVGAPGSSRWNCGDSVTAGLCCTRCHMWLSLAWIGHHSARTSVEKAICRQEVWWKFWFYLFHARLTYTHLPAIQIKSKLACWLDYPTPTPRVWLYWSSENSVVQHRNHTNNGAKEERFRFLLCCEDTVTYPAEP